MAEAKLDVREARHEPTDIAEGFVWVSIVAVAALLIGCALLVFIMYPHLDQDRLLALPLPSYPAPRLQADPAADMRRERARQLSRLNGGGLDEPGGFGHIPIGQAMQIIAAEGVAGWPGIVTKAAARAPDPQ